MPTSKRKSSIKPRIVRMTAAEARQRTKSRPLYPGELTTAQLKRLRDDEIDYSDIPELDEEFFRLARILTPGKKRSLSLRIDEDVYQWLKNQGPGYQTRINAMLKALMLTQEKKR